MNAMQVYASTDKAELAAFFDELMKQGTRGQFAIYLMLAQRAQRLLRLELDRKPIPNKEMEKVRRHRNNWAMDRLFDYVAKHRDELKLKPKNFKYGVRLKFHAGASIRFRSDRGEWLGDADNVQPICDYCDSLVEHGRHNEQPGQVLSWPAAV